MDQVPQGWAGVDVGKGHHWVCLTGEDGTTLWSSKVINDESAILDAIGEVCARAEQVTWAVDVTGTMSGLLLALLAAHNQAVKYVPGRVANKMADTYRGEGKTDARDAYVIAETVRQRGDLTEVEVAATLVTELRLLVTHRTDLVADRVRLVNRLRDSLSGYFPALERAFDYAHSRGALVLLTGYQTPAAIRRIGKSRLHTWLVKRKVRSADQIAADATNAAAAQHTVVPGQQARRLRSWPHHGAGRFGGPVALAGGRAEPGRVRRGRPRFICGACEPVGQHGGGGLPREPWIGAFEPERQTFEFSLPSPRRTPLFRLRGGRWDGSGAPALCGDGCVEEGRQGLRASRRRGAPQDRGDRDDVVLDDLLDPRAA